MKRVILIVLAICAISLSVGCGGFSSNKPTTVGATETTATGSILDQMNSKLDSLNSQVASLKIQIAQLQSQIAGLSK